MTRSTLVGVCRFLSFSLLAVAPAGLAFGQAGKAQSWQVKWEKVVKAAEEEGPVTVWAFSGIGNMPIIWEAFQKRYPRIKLAGTPISRGSEMLPKLMAERRAGKYLLDVLVWAPTTLFTNLYPAKALDPIRPALILPEVTDPRQWWQGEHRYADPEGRYIFMYEGTLAGLSVAYNTGAVNPADIKSVWDLLDPKWKGKIAVRYVPPGEGSTSLILIYHHPEIGPKFLEGLYSKMDVTMFGDFRQGTDWLARGKYPLCFLCRGIKQAKDQGLPVADLNPYQLKEIPGIGSAVGSIALMNRNPHPNAAKVFINWYLSREGQIAFRQAGSYQSDERTSLREDLPLDILPPSARRKKDKEYIYINRPEWMNFKPIDAVIGRLQGGIGIR